MDYKHPFSVSFNHISHFSASNVLLILGKTTTVAVVSKELGFDTVEFNASDTRSKNLIQQQITEVTCNNSLSGFFNGIYIPFELKMN